MKLYKASIMTNPVSKIALSPSIYGLTTLVWTEQPLRFLLGTKLDTIFFPSRRSQHSVGESYKTHEIVLYNTRQGSCQLPQVMQKYSSETWELEIKAGWIKKRSQVIWKCDVMIAPNSESEEIQLHLLEKSSERLWSVTGSHESCI